MDIAIEQIDDEIAFQQTLLASLEDLPDGNEDKAAIKAAIVELEQRLEALTAASSGNASHLPESENEEPGAQSDTSSTFSFPPRSSLGNGKRPASPSAHESQSKRHSSFKREVGAHMGPAERALQRQRLAEEQAARRRQLEAADAALAHSLSQGPAESSSSAASRSNLTSTFGHANALNVPAWSGHTSSNPLVKHEPQIQSTLYRSTPVKQEAPHTPRPIYVTVAQPHR
ncbi:hypothetical protein MRB53_041458 [Persea americana]|nr:hypothetical protein MRB53_041458 [Persea americana]